MQRKNHKKIKNILNQPPSWFNKYTTFTYCCSINYDKIAKLIFANKSNIDISPKTFQIAFYNGKLETTKWLLRIKPTLNITAKIDNYVYIYVWNYIAYEVKNDKMVVAIKTTKIYSKFAKQIKKQQCKPKITIYNKKQQIAKQL